MSRRAHENGDCSGDWTCIWCWDETEDDQTEGDEE